MELTVVAMNSISDGSVAVRSVVENLNSHYRQMLFLVSVIHGSDSTFPSHAGFVESVRIAQSLAGIKAKATEMSPGSYKAAPSPCSTARTWHQRPK
jgi:hypothetical protein